MKVAIHESSVAAEISAIYSTAIGPINACSCSLGCPELLR